jgi:hypothetical protein
MKKHKREEREMRDRRRKQVLKRIQEDEWKEPWQYWASDAETIPDNQMEREEQGDGH